MLIKSTGLLVLGFISWQTLVAQDDDLSKLLETTPAKERVIATFKTTRLVNANTIEQVKNGELDFRVAHRFDDIGGKAGGVTTLYGLDNVVDIRISFDYGITDRWSIGFGRSKGGYEQRQILDFNTKGKLKIQEDHGFPFSISVFEAATVTTMKSVSDETSANYFARVGDRVSYTSQLILARKFNNWLSLELLPTYVHRNKVAYNDYNGVFALGVGGRIKFSKRSAIIFDYYQVFNDYMVKKNGFYPPIGIGYEVETGGHVFHLLFSNTRSLLDGQYITQTKENPSIGQIRFGFNISRVFNLK